MKNIFKDRCFLTLALALALILVVGWFKPETEKSRWQGDYFWSVKTHYKQNFDLVILGDSRAIRAFSPGAMEDVLPGYRVYNFAYSGGGLNPVMYKAGEKKLDPGSKKKIILLGVTPRSLTSLSNRNVLFRKQVRMPKTEIFQRVYVNPVLAFFEPLKPDRLINRLLGKKKKEILIEEFRADGWVASSAIPENPRKLLKPYLEYYSKTRVSRKNVDFLVKQTRRWTKKGILVFALRLPTTPAMVALEKKHSGFNEADLVKRFREAGGVWIPVEPSRYKSYDGSHLNKQSAIKLSEDVARYIKSEMYREIKEVLE
jgi:hypothetical protein